MAIESVSRAAYQTSSVSQQPKQVEAVSTVHPVETQPQTIQNVKTSSDMGNENSSKKDDPASIEKDNEKVKKAVADLNKRMDNTSCQFGIHEGTGRVTIKIVDKETKDVIKEFPAEETLDMIQKAWELAGLMVDEKR